MTEAKDGVSGFKVVKIKDYNELYKAFQYERNSHIAAVKRYKSAIKFMKMVNVFNIFSKKWMK